MSTRRTDKSRGFTLIEVLVALAIVAIGMAAVLGTLTSSARTVLFMHDKTLAQWVALNQIAQQRLTGQIPALGKTDGDLDYAGQKWHWRQDVVATAVQGMVRLDVMVRPSDIKSDDDHNWYVTMSGIMGDAVGAPRGDTPMWGTGVTTGAPCTGGTNGGATTPGTGTNGTTTPGTTGTGTGTTNCTPGTGGTGTTGNGTTGTGTTGTTGTGTTTTK